MLHTVIQLAKVFGILLLPFILLIRGSVYLHEHYKLLPYISILGGMAFAIVILFVYFSFLYGQFTGKFGEGASLKRRGLIAVAIVVLYAMHGIFYISGQNLHNTALRSEIHDVHPIVRLSVSTLIHLDKDLIITDADRLPEDYRRMGLKSIKHSLHYKQSSGYSHALDIRTRHRHGIRNFLVKSYFIMMGFNTLRHGGAGTTGDHLHISLMSHDRPYAK